MLPTQFVFARPVVTFAIVKVTRLQVFLMSLLTLVGMGGIGLLLIVFAQDIPLADFWAIMVLNSPF